MEKKSDFLFIEPYNIGSHSLFLEGLIKHSEYNFDVITMPGENFRWRILGSALYIANNIPNINQYKGLVITDLFNLADFKAIVGPKCPPVIAYFHENQLTYPQPAGDKSIVQLGMINITTAISADLVLFNSNFHMKQFLAAVQNFIKRMPDFRPKNIQAKIRQKSRVIYPGISLPPVSQKGSNNQHSSPIIIWNHRWGFDKNFEMFYAVLKVLVEENIKFRIALLGENFGKIPDAFHQAKELLGNNILQYGYEPSRKEYTRWLKRGSVVVSTSNQENFGMSIVEAMLMGCIPLLPDRLSYPEILPEKFHHLFLYKNKNDLVVKLKMLINDPGKFIKEKTELTNNMEYFLWKNLIGEYDLVLRELL